MDGLKEDGKKAPKKTWDIHLHSVWGDGVASPLVPEVFTPAGAAAVSGWHAVSGRGRGLMAERVRGPAKQGRGRVSRSAHSQMRNHVQLS